MTPYRNSKCEHKDAIGCGCGCHRGTCIHIVACCNYCKYCHRFIPTHYWYYVTKSSGIANWDPIQIALVRKSMPRLIAHDICGVQPMSAPTGLVFTLKTEYANKKSSGGNCKVYNIGSRYISLNKQRPWNMQNRWIPEFQRYDYEIGYQR